jgi:hypothetical protein
MDLQGKYTQATSNTIGQESKLFCNNLRTWTLHDMKTCNLDTTSYRPTITTSSNITGSFSLAELCSPRKVVLVQFPGSLSLAELFSPRKVVLVQLPGSFSLAELCSPRKVVLVQLPGSLSLAELCSQRKVPGSLSPAELCSPRKVVLQDVCCYCKVCFLPLHRLFLQSNSIHQLHQSRSTTSMLVLLAMQP